MWVNTSQLICWHFYLFVYYYAKWDYIKKNQFSIGTNFDSYKVGFKDRPLMKYCVILYQILVPKTPLCYMMILINTNLLFSSIICIQNILIQSHIQFLTKFLKYLTIRKHKIIRFLVKQLTNRSFAFSQLWNYSKSKPKNENT